MDRSREPARARAAEQAAGEPSVLAIVVTHNGRSWLKDCLVSLNVQTYGPLDVLVVDDASLDSRHQPHLKRVAKRHLRRRRWGYVRARRPLGFGGAINWALSRVRTDADLLLFLHDDVVLDPDAVARMVARVEQDEKTAIVGPKVADYNDPDRLEEVGLAVDVFGYPYKGLEEHEIDLGQHDVASEVFYVTSTCMLVRHSTFKELRGWDGRMRAFTEDLDFCWRARIAGHTVRVEPGARVRHDVALATGLRPSPFVPQRYFIRRNRLRALLKNVAAVRLALLLPAYLLLTLAEMVGFIVLRQPGEVLNLARAWGWNLVNLPQTLSERARVQRRRRVPDGALRRLMVRQSTRIRFYATHQAERLEEAWGRRAELLGQRQEQARAAARSLRGLTGVIIALALIAFMLGFRHVLFGQPASVGELLPYPDRATALWRAFVSPWRGAGLGQPGPAPPAFVFLGLFPMLSLGAVGLAQKLLVLTLGVAAFAGAYKLVAVMTDRPSRIVAGLAYALGAVGYAGVREGALGALVFGAAAPFAVGAMLPLIGWMRPPGWRRSSGVAKLTLAGAVSAAFVPGSLVLYAVVAVLLTATRTFLERGGRAARGLLSCIVGLVGSWALLLPWSWTWFRPGAPLAILTSDPSWRVYAEGFAGHGVTSVLLAQTPDLPPLLGLCFVVLGVVAVFATEGQRRRVALALWTIVVAVGWLTSAFASGALRPVVASPTEAGVLAATAFAGLAGIALSGFRLDLPRRGLGLAHAVTITGLAVALFLGVTGLGPAVLSGAWDPGEGSDRAGASERAQIADLLSIQAAQSGQFRALWVGERWSSPVPSAARPPAGAFVTQARGEVLGDLFELRSGTADARLASVVSSVEQGLTDRGGALLGAFNIRYVVLDRDEEKSAWLEQRDLAVVRSEPGYLLLESESYLPRAGVFEDVPRVISAIDGGDTATVPAHLPIDVTPVIQRSSARYEIPDPPAQGVVFLAEAAHPRWQAGTGADPVEAGWGNAWRVEPGGDPVVLAFPRSLSDIAWVLVVGFAWLAVIGAAIPRRVRRGGTAR